MKNWKTTLFGVIGGLATLFGPHLSGAPGPAVTTGNVVTAAALILLGLVSKDANVTGGSVAQTPEAVSRATAEKI
jgi:hypothetical protein